MIKQIKHHMYNTIIPNLVSFNTKLKNIKSFGFAENFDFFKEISKPEKFHYEIGMEKDISIPNDYEFRNGYFLKKGNSWYYERKFFGISLKFKYDKKNKIFYFNKNYSYLPFEIGSIYPVGRHIADLINMDLFLGGYNLFRGCAFHYRDKNYCFIAPGLNGKTTLLADIISKGGKYIAEDILIINLNEKKVYPSACFKKNFGRSINRKLFENLKKNIISESIEYDHLFLLENSNTLVGKNIESGSKKIDNFLFLCSLFFLNNNFTRSVISEENNLPEIFNQIENIKNNLNYKYLKINNFNFEKIIE